MDKKDFARVYSTHIVTDRDKRYIPAEQLERIVMHKLSEYLCNCILENCDELPVIRTIEQGEEHSFENHSLMINLISNEEYYRLLKIEREYLKEKFKCETEAD